MKILMVSHLGLYWTPLYARSLTAAGHRVLVASFDSGLIEGVEHEFIGIEPWEANKHAYLVRIPRLSRLIRRFDPDVVFATYLVSNGLAAVSAWRGPTVVSAHGYDLLLEGTYRGWQRRVRDRVARYVCRRAALTHVVSREMHAQVVSFGIDPARVTYIPVGIDVSRFPLRSPADVRAPLHIMCTRRHEPVYRNDTIIEGLAQVKASGRAFRFTIVGAGPLTPDLQALVQSKGLSSDVSFAGQVPQAMLPTLLQSADVYVSASVVDGTSSALLEAMATGLFPVVSRITSNRAWLEDHTNALMFTVDDSNEFASAMTRALDDHELRRRAVVSNRLRVEEEGDFVRNAGRLERALSSAAGNGGH